MNDWRERICGSAADIAEFSADSMAAHRIMKSIGGTVKDIGRLCRQFNIPYREEESFFQRAVQIFREVYSPSSLVEVFDVHSARRYEDISEDLLSDSRSALLFIRFSDPKSRVNRMTAYVRGVSLNTSPLGSIVIRPGIRYIACQNGIQLWEQDPVTLLRSFKKEE